MPKPQNKLELQAISQKRFRILMELVNSYSKEELKRTFPEDKLNKNVRDVLTHLHEWHQLFLGWHKVGLTGIKPEMPAKGYTWQTLPDLNIVIWQKYQDTSLDKAIELLEDSSDKVQSIIQMYSDQELFEKKKYPWTGSTSLAAYIISNTCSHYDWAIKRIKKSLKT